jgi:peptide deformylase
MKIVHYPHPALRHVARPVASIDKTVNLQIAAMLELLYEHRGLGLAGPQVAWPFRVFVMNLKGDPNAREAEGVFLNPVIVERRGSVEGEEGCLSFPGFYQKVRRAKTMRAQAYNLKGELVEVSASDLEARVWQHEVDHLDGRLFIDKIGPIARMTSRAEIRKFEKEFKRLQERGEIPADAEIERQLKAWENGSVRVDGQSEAGEEPQKPAPATEEPGQTPPDAAAVM